MSPPLLVLGSRSPRRRELLSLLVPTERMMILPPSVPDEPGFEGCHDEESIRNQILHIARMKCEAVRSRPECPADGWVLTADTVIVAGEPGDYHVLGQPPAGPTWPRVVRHWFQSFYLNRTHRAMTAVVLSRPGYPRVERLVETRVSMKHASSKLLDWYLETGESIGKAGGYALQGAGSLFIDRVDGSLSNVVGMPLEVVLELLLEFDPAHL